MEEKTKRQTAKRSVTSRQYGETPGKPPSTQGVEGVFCDAGNKVRLEVLDIIDALPFYVLLVDADHYILLANRTVKTHLGLNPSQIIGHYCPKVVHGLDEPFPGCPLEEAAEKNMAIEREILDGKSGRWVMSAIYPTRGLTREGKRIFLHVVIDITQRKQAEEQLKASRERLRGLSAHLESVREEEKRRIARDLHDETSQVLASLNAHLEAAIGLLPAAEDKLNSMLRKAQALSIGILDEIHKLIYELHPLQLDELGLVAAIGSLIEDNLKAAGVEVRFRASGKALRYNRRLEITLFRVIQEAISNITKHAYAKHVVININFRRNVIRVHIQDDGKGFDVEEALNTKDRPRGYGLLSMEERVELLNGVFNICSSPGSGTKIDIEIPLNCEVSYE